MAGIYQPQEDTELLLAEVKKTVKPGMRVLDMGTGSGILALAAIEKGAEVTAVDINSDAVVVLNKKKNSKKNSKLSVIESDLFNELEKFEGFFDLILFNPPYLPADARDSDIALDGGVQGFELIIQFLKEAKRFLTPDGSILLLFSSLSNPVRIQKAIKEEGYLATERVQLALFMERLYVYELRLRR